jgi:acetyl esterase/lipase
VTGAVAQEPTPTERPAQDRLAGADPHVYKRVGDVELKLFVFKPRAWQPTDRRPAIVFFFGGGWRSGSPAQFAPQARRLASLGMVAACAEYRVYSRHEAKVADCVADARSAIRWMRSRAAELGIDPQRIAAGGGSAGGHLAAAVATLDGFDDPQDNLQVSCRPNALALFNPALDLTAFPRDRDSNRSRDFLGRLGGSLEELSPGLHIIPGLPPTILFHGRADKTVPFAQAESFAAKMQQCGNRCELAAYDDAGHGFFNHGRGDGSAYADTLRRLEEFLARLGYVSERPRADEPMDDRGS